MLEFFQIALRSILANKLRSGLTLLGVVIGVWAITSMQGVVEGFDRAIEKELSALGTESFVIQKFPPVMVGHNWRRYARRKDFTYEDAVYLEQQAANIRVATAVVQTHGQTIKYKDKKTSPSVRTTGTMSGYLATQSAELADGRFLTDDDVSHTRQVAILGRDVITELFPYEDPLSKSVLVNGQAFTVIGVLGQTPSTFGQSADNVVIIPITAYQKVFTTSRRQMRNTSLILRAWDAQGVGEATDEVIALLRVRRKVPLGQENDFELLTAESAMNTVLDFTFYIRIAAIGIAGISLLVAGIGIMNIMLVSVMERTREIGTRKAVGARRWHILVQFLIEAVLLSELGALMGILLGVITTVGVSPLLEMEARIPAWAAIAALGYCSVIGIFFGLYPANKASKLDPIEALRYE
ncbi:MAG: ABC transporter permease [Fidelibacterota bacterium]|nr:MAG: ABC transporter permease [Candidatus Neomarinimicrobiota bacterium]